MSGLLGLLLGIYLAAALGFFGLVGGPILREAYVTAIEIKDWVLSLVKSQRKAS